MPSGYRHVLTALAGLAALCVALGAGAFFGSLYAPDHKNYGAVSADRSGNDDYSGPSKSLPDIASLPGLVERAIANPPSPTAQDHESRDLAAQEASALWAFWMVVVTTLSMGVTIFGTILLYKQIILTREAVEDTGRATEQMVEANNIAREVARPWVMLTCQFTKCQEFQGTLFVDGILTVKNVGQSTATGFSILCEVTRPIIEETRDNFFYSHYSAGWVGSEVLMPGEEMSFPFEKDIGLTDNMFVDEDSSLKGLMIIISASVVYFSATRKPYGPRQTGRSFMLQWQTRDGDWHHLLPRNGLTILPEKLGSRTVDIGHSQ